MYLRSCIHHYSIIQNSFTALKIPCAHLVAIIIILNNIPRPLLISSFTLGSVY